MTEALLPENVDCAADLHQRVLGDTFNSQVGDWFIKKLYSFICSSEGSYCYVHWENGNMAGLVSFCLDRSALEKELLGRLGRRNKIRVGIFALVRPWLWPKVLAGRLFNRHWENNLQHPCAFILTLGVSPFHQGKGIGRSLVEKVKEIVRSKGISTLYVDTEATNKQAQVFYEKIGFRKVANKFGNVIYSCSV